ncbi:lipoprotein-releasing ABC transporter permease subunit LolE [Thalassotalea agariperforans]
MIKPISLFLALRYVSRRHSSGFSSFISASSTLGIALGVMVLIIVLSAMNGFEKALADKLLSIIPHAELESVNEPIDNWPATAKKMLANPEVLAVAPAIKMTGMVQKAGQLKGVELRGVDVNSEQLVSDISQYITAGKWQNLSSESSDKQGLIIGSGIAKKLALKLGDKVQLLLPINQPVANGMQQQFPAPTVRHVEVVAIFTFGGVIDDTLAYISLAQAQDILGYTASQVNTLRIKVPDVFQARAIISNIAYQLDNYVYIHDWTRTQGHLFQDIQLVRMVMFIVLALVIAVASFNIVSTLIMVVNEKKGDIAILKTMGASPLLIMLSFIIQGLVNGIVGCCLGTGLGIYLALNLTHVITKIESVFSTKILSGDVYFIDFIPSQLQWPDVYITVTIALVLSLFATIYPAWRATKVDPAQVLGQM